MKTPVLHLVVVLLLQLAPSHCEELGDVFLVLINNREESQRTGPYVLEDYFCLDPVLPLDQSSCRIRVLAPVKATFSESRLWNVSLDFQHPSRARTVCHVRWPPYEDVRVWCERSGSGLQIAGVPKFRTETATDGIVDFYDLIRSETKCYHTIGTIEYHRDGLTELPEKRPTVVFRTEPSGCVAGVVGGYRANDYRTTEPPCRYFRRRKCWPLRKDQYNALIRDIEAGDLYADFRTSSERPPERSSSDFYTSEDVVQ
ncbi:uncharacterized protein LOC124155856 [Ischnura elegans]|uniref:uncharacterized protein LOC124155856 n=1 Tax=Ischnura elegans TaxID=197161 RepID=UPI001ED8BB05|nr:uncharacterized protein LOC124155856 [Ischnura elegans]